MFSYRNDKNNIFIYLLFFIYRVEMEGRREGECIQRRETEGRGGERICVRSTVS